MVHYCDNFTVRSDILGGFIVYYCDLCHVRRVYNALKLHLTGGSDGL